MRRVVPVVAALLLALPVTVRADPATLGRPASRAEMTRLLAALDLGTYTSEDTAPPFRAMSRDGRSVTLADLKGHVVLLTFWATWCAPCKDELPMFEQLHRAYEARGLTVIGINVRESGPVITAFGQALGLTFPLLADPDGDISRRYGAVGLPVTFLLNRSGKPVGRAVGPRPWSGRAATAIVEALLAEPRTQ